MKAKFGDTFLLDQLEKFDCSSLSHKFVEKYKNYFMSYTTAELKAVSVACSYLYQWCEDQVCQLLDLGAWAKPSWNLPHSAMVNG